MVLTVDSLIPAQVLSDICDEIGATHVKVVDLG
jgi:hypothetical protein